MAVLMWARHLLFTSLEYMSLLVVLTENNLSWYVVTLCFSVYDTSIYGLIIFCRWTSLICLFGLNFLSNMYVHMCPSTCFF